MRALKDERKSGVQGTEPIGRLLVGMSIRSIGLRHSREPEGDERS